MEHSAASRPPEVAPQADTSDDAHGRHALPPARRRWRHSWFNTSISLLLLAGLTLLIYPTAAAWVSQQNQSNIVSDQTSANEQLAQERVGRMLAEAHAYNEALVSGALLAGGSNLAEGTGRSLTDTVDPGQYWETLNTQPSGLLARLRIPSIRLDLPVYHGTSDATLLKGPRTPRRGLASCRRRGDTGGCQRTPRSRERRNVHPDESGGGRGHLQR